MTSKAPITTHVLNLDSGRPATGLRVTLYFGLSGEAITRAETDGDGRIARWRDEFELKRGHYRLHFETGDWFAQRGLSSFYPVVDITFQVRETGEHYHVPLLLNAFGYSTYRGS